MGRRKSGCNFFSVDSLWYSDELAYWTRADGVEQGVCCIVVVDFGTYELVESVSA